MNKNEFKEWLYSNSTGGSCDGINDEIILKVSADEIVNAACRYQSLQCRYPWIFYFTIRFRFNWFSYWWKTRGANFVELQLLCFQINIGRPWAECYLESQIRDYGTLQHVKNTNDVFKKKWIRLQIGKYKNHK